MKTFDWLVMAALAFTAFAPPETVEQIIDRVKQLGGGSVSTPTDWVNVPEPTAELKQIVQPVVDAMEAAGNPKGQRAFAELYVALAQIFETNDSLKSVTQLQQLLNRAGKILDSQVELKMPGVSDALAKMWQAQIEPGPLTAEKKKRIIDIMNAVAWAAV